MGSLPRALAVRRRHCRLDLDQLFPVFCEGCNLYSPAWQHATEYWDTAKRWPEKVLFVRYKEILRDPAENIRRIAEFIECPFTVVNRGSGMV
jgi:hypothetical protein